LILGGSVNLGTAPGAYRTINVGGNSLVLTGVVSNGTNATPVTSIEKTGAGNLQLNNQNTYTGDTILSGGQVRMGVDPIGSVGSITTSSIGTGRIVFNGGGLASFLATPRTVLNPVAFGNSSSNWSALLGDPLNNGKLTFSAGMDLGFTTRSMYLYSDAQINGLITGTGGYVDYGGVNGALGGGGLAKAGPGLLTLTNAGNNYTGATAVLGGTLRPTVVGAIPANTNLIVASQIGNGYSVLDLATSNLPLTVNSLNMGGRNVNGNGSTTGWSVLNTGDATHPVTLAGSVTYDATAAAYTATINGNLALGTANLSQYNYGNYNWTGAASYQARDFNVNDSTNAAPDMNVAAIVSGTAGLAKNGAGMLLLSANNSYSGATVVNAGTLFVTGNNTLTGPTWVSGGALVARSANALGGNSNTAGVTVFNNTSFSYNASADAPLAIGGNLDVVGVNNNNTTTLGATIGSGTDSSAINVAGNATTPLTANSIGATIVVNLYGNSSSGTAGGSGTYTLIHGAGVSNSLNNANYTLGKVYNATNFTVSSTLVKSANDLQATIATATPITSAYWTGGATAGNSIWAASSGISGSTGVASSNWATAPATTAAQATAQVLVPGSGADVFFVAPILVQGDRTQPNTPITLGSDMSIKSLTMNDFVNNALSLNADGYTLSVGTGGISVLGTADNQTVTINAAVKLAAAQTWTVNGYNGQFNPNGWWTGAPTGTNYGRTMFTVNGNVDNGGNLLTVNTALSATNTNINGTISGANGLTKIGGYGLTLSGANTYTGNTTINYGTLYLGSAGMPGASPLGTTAAGTYVNGNNAALDLNGQSIYTDEPLFLNGMNGNGALTNAGGAATWTGPITLQSDSSIGGNVVVGGAGAFTGGGFNLYLNRDGTTGNFARVIDTSVNSVIKGGSGTWILSGANTYTGATTINYGSLKLGINNAIPTSSPVSIVGLGNNTNGTLDLNGFNQSLSSLTMAGMPQNDNNGTPTVTSSLGTSVLTLTGGASAFTVSAPLASYRAAAGSVSNVTVDMNGAATFNLAGYGVTFSPTSVIRNGDLTKTNVGLMTLQGVNTYTGATNIYGGTVQLNGDLGTINQSSSIAIAGGAALYLQNVANAIQPSVDRVKNTAPIAAYGGNIQYVNTATAGVAYTETIGAVTTNAGQFDILLNNNQTGGSGNSQTLTLGGLTHNNTSAVTFSSIANPDAYQTPTGLNATINTIKVTGATQTASGRIIGAWATVGRGNTQQKDYAVYDASGNVVGANIANSAETTWTDSTQAYTMAAANYVNGTNQNDSITVNLTGNRTMAGLRNFGQNDILNLGSNNLYTYGLLQGGRSAWNINTSGGSVSTPTGGGNLYITAGNDDNNPWIYLNAPITNNGGAVTVVKSGYNNLYLRGTNSYTGGTVFNAGTTYVNNASALGSSAGTLTFAGGSIDTENVAGLSFANPVVFNGNGTYVAANSLAMTFTGLVNLGTAPGAYRSIGVNNGGALIFSNVISNGTTVNSIEKTGAGTLQLNNQNTYTGDTILSGGAIQLGVDPVGTVGSITSSAIGTGRIVFSGGGLVSSGTTARTILNPVTFGNSTSNVSANLGSGAAGGALTFSGAIDLGFTTRVINTNGAVQFGGPITGSGGFVDYGGTSYALGGGGLAKGGVGLLTLTNAGNNYTGATAVLGGTLRPTVVGAIPANTNLIVASDIGGGYSVLDLATNNIPLTVNSLNMGGRNVNASASTTGWSVLNTGDATHPVTLAGSVTYDITAAAYTATINGNLALGTANLSQYNYGNYNWTGTASVTARDFNVNDSTNAAPDMNVAAIVSGTAGLAKNSAGVLLLSGNNTYSGATVVNAGTLFVTGNNTLTGPTWVNGGALLARSANALGGNSNTAGVTLFNGTSFSYNATSDAQLAIGGNLDVVGVNNNNTTTFGATIGSGTNSSEINVAGNATTPLTANSIGANIMVNLYGNSSSSTAGGSGTYTLIHGAGGSSSLNNATYTLGKVYNNTNFTVSSTLVKSANDLQAVVTAATPLTTVFWKGGLTGATANWAASNGASQSNWVASNGGANQALVPGATADVIFSNSSVTTSQNGSTLGADMSVRGITLLDTTNTLILNADNYALTIGAGGINMPNLPAAAINQAHAIYPNITLGAAQTWMNNNANGNTLTVYGNVANGGNLLTVDNSGNAVTIFGAISGSGGLTKYGSNTLAIQGPNSSSGPTSIFRGSMTISGARGTINQTSAITLGNNAGIVLTNASADSSIDRMGTAAIGVYGGYLQFNNTATANVNYAQTVGAVTLNVGQFDVTLNNSSNSNDANSRQILTLGGLAQNGASAVTFSVPTTTPNATNNMIKVTGATATTAGQIIGPWATVGTASNAQTDYAVYDGSTNIVPAAIADSAETTWTSGSLAYTMSAAKTLSANRIINTLRASSASLAVTQNQFNLETNGLLQGSTGVFTINSTSGVLRQQGTAAANMYLNTGSGGITINSPIQNNTGALTLVKDGSGGNLILSGLNSFTGGVVINAGNVQMGAINSVFSIALGTGPLVMNGGSIDSNTANMFNLNNNALTINGDFSTTATQSLYFGTGAATLGTAPGLSRQISVTNTFTLGGAIANGTTANSIINVGAGNLILSGANTYNGFTRLDNGLLQIGVDSIGSVGAITSSAIGTGTLIFNGGALSSYSIAPRTVLNPVTFTGNATIGDAVKIGKLTFGAGVDLAQVVRTLNIPGGDVQFDGAVSSVAGGFTKTGIGTLILNNAANTYGGSTNVALGTLRLGPTGSLPTGNNVSIGSITANQTAVLDLNGQNATIGTLTLGGPTVFINNTSTNASATGSSLVTTGLGTLTLGGDLTYNNGQNPFRAIVAGNLNLGTANLTSSARQFQVNDSSSTTNNAAPDLIVSAAVAGTAGLTKLQSGMMLLSGNNAYAGTTTLNGGSLFITGNNTTTGATTITNGTLIARSANALGGSGNSAGVAVAASQNLTYNAAADSPLAIGGNLAYAGVGTLGATIGSDLTTSDINVTGNATTTAAAITVNIFGNSLSRTVGGAGNYTLIHGAAGSSLNNATYTLGTVYNNTNFTVSSTLIRSVTDLQATVTTATALNTAYWKGTGSASPTVWAASSNGAVASNWTSDLASTTVTAVVPGLTTDVFFSGTGITSPSSSTLGADMTIKSLTTQLNATAMTVNADGYTLTISPASSTAGINLLAQAAMTFNPNLALGAAQTWTNNSGTTFTVNGNVINGSNNLTVTGANQTTLVGTIGGLPGNAGGSGSITKNGPGTLVLQGYNTFTGGITVNQGTVQFENPNAFGTGTLTLNQGVTINSNFGNLINANNNAVAINGDFTFTGSQNLFLGTGNVTLGSANDPTPTITANTNTLTLGGVIGNGTSANGLAKFGSGTLILAGANTYSGPTTITQATLKIGTTNAISGNTVAMNPTNNATSTLDLNGFNQTLGNLTITGVPTSANQAASTVTNANVAAPSTLTLTGGANAFAVYPLQGFALNAPTLSVNTVDLNNAAQTFYIGGNLNGTTTITSNVQNGSLIKAGPGGLVLQGVNSYSGSTAIYGGTVTVNGNLGAINSATGGIALVGGTLALTNAANQNLVNRLADGAAITSFGGGLQFTNTIGAGVVYSETVGNVALNNGQWDVLLNTDQTSGSGNKQTLALGTLTHNNVSAVTFSGVLGNSTTPSATNIITVSGASTTTAGQIIGPWATVGTAAGTQTDYAVYNNNQVVAANITATAENAPWATNSNVTASSWPTLTATRTLNSLRITADNGTMNLNQFNLETNGILFTDASANAKNISGTSGVVRQSGTSPANLYITGGQGAGLITISANIQDNTGALTLVKNGSAGSLALTGLNSFTGGVVVNQGTVQVNATNSNFTTGIGTGPVIMSSGAIDTLAGSVFNLNNNALTINGDFNTMPLASANMNFGTGNVSLGTAPGFSRKISVNAATNTFTLGGAISDGTTVNSLTKAGAGNLFLSGANTYSGDTYIANGFIQMGVGNVGSLGSITSSAIGKGRLIFINDGNTVGGLASDSVAPRTILNPVVFENNALFGNAANNGIGKLTFSAGVDLGFAPRTLTLANDVDFNGVVTGPGGVAGGGIIKTGPGTLTLTNAGNNYGGSTSVIQGTLKTTAAGALPYLTNVYVAETAANQTAILDLAGNSTTIGTLQMGGYTNTLSAAGNTIVINGANQTASATGSSLVSTRAGALTLGGDLTYQTGGNPFTATISGNLALGTLNLTQGTAGLARAFTINDSTGANAAPDMVVSANISGSGVGINKTGSGMLLLSGNNAYTGPTILNGGSLFITGNNAVTTTAGLTSLTSGTLVARSQNALGGIGNTAGVTVAASQNLTYNAAADAKLAIGGNLTFAGAATVGATIGTNLDTSAINVSGNATTSGAITVNIYGNSGSTTVGNGGIYTLIHGGAGSNLGTPTYTLGTIYNNTNFTVNSTLIKSGVTDLQATVTTATALNTAYWKGTGTTISTV